MKNNLSESIIKNLKEGKSVKEQHDDLIRNVLNMVEMYVEAKANEDDDVFGGTQDAYANEVFEQNLFDVILYSELINHDMDKASDVYNKILDIVYGTNDTDKAVADVTKYIETL